MQTKTQCVIEKKNKKFQRKNLSTALQAKNDPLVYKLEYNNAQRHSKPMLSDVFKPSKLQLSMNF